VLAMLADVIRSVLEESRGRELSNDELAELVYDRLGKNDKDTALKQALSPLISTYRSAQNRRILGRDLNAPPPPEDLPPLDIPPSVPVSFSSSSGSVSPGGAQYTSARNALISDSLLSFTISGAGNRSVPLRRAGIADIRHEADRSRKSGRTYLDRAQIFEDMLREMARVQAQGLASLPPESLAAYAQRLADLQASRPA
jgi:hypothetical protein